MQVISMEVGYTAAPFVCSREMGRRLAVLLAQSGEYMFCPLPPVPSPMTSTSFLGQIERFFLFMLMLFNVLSHFFIEIYHG